MTEKNNQAEPAGDVVDLRELHTRLVQGDFYDDYDEASRLVGVLRCHVEALERPASSPTPVAGGEVGKKPWEVLRDIVTPTPFHHNEAAWTVMLRLIGEKCFPTPDPVGKIVAWPTAAIMVDCEPCAVSAIAIRAGADDAPYGSCDPRFPDPSEVAFWDRVKDNADRIARWAVDGLGITGRAIERGDWRDTPLDTLKNREQLLAELSEAIERNPNLRAEIAAFASSPAEKEQGK